jgi:hypothetical protein
MQDAVQEQVDRADTTTAADDSAANTAKLNTFNGLIAETTPKTDAAIEAEREAFLNGIKFTSGPQARHAQRRQTRTELRKQKCFEQRRVQANQDAQLLERIAAHNGINLDARVGAPLSEVFA